MIRKYLPQKIYSKLFGNRNKFGTKIIKNDTCWIEWLKFYEKFYLNTQKKGVGNIVNEMGYKILNNVEFDDKIVLELGPGNLPHRKFWLNEPKKFYAIDTNPNFLKETEKQINCNFKGIEVSRTDKIPLGDESIDIILSFYSLEHILNLDQMLSEFKRVLKKEGKIVGAIPNEGGLAWGLGRYFTSRRFVQKNSDINYDKIICWEHPNFSDDIINSFKKNNLKINFIKMYPFNFLKSLDLNLVTTFILSKN